MKKVHDGAHLFVVIILFLTLLLPTLRPRLSFTHADGGLNWPRGQILPHFCCITSLNIINLNGLSPEMHTLFVTLQGLINRTQPRIYVHEGDEKEGTNFWLDKLNVPYINVADPFSLIAKYRSEIAGTVVYDPTVPDTINLATTIAGIKGGIVASPGLAAMLSSDSYNLPILVDLRSNKFPSKLAVYQYAYDTYWPLAEHRLIVGLDSRLPGTVRDYAIATKAMVVWLNPRVAAEKALLTAFFQGMAPGNSYLGWWSNETAGVQEASQYGIATYAADFSSNLTVLGATPHTILVPIPPPLPPLQHKIYVTMIMSDGDNIQLTQHRLPQRWADPIRGLVPIGWTINPGLVDLAPVMLNYYWSTATKNDDLISGPSGLGYIQANNVPANALTIYTQQTAAYLRVAGLRVITIWNTSPFMPNTAAYTYAQNIPDLLGLTTESGANADYTGQRLFAGKLPIISLTVPYATSIDALEQAIANADIGFSSTTRPRFIAVQVATYSQAINPTALYLVQQYFIHNPDYQFVRPDHFFQLFKESRFRTFPTPDRRKGIRPVISRQGLTSDPGRDRMCLTPFKQGSLPLPGGSHTYGVRTACTSPQHRIEHRRCVNACRGKAKRMGVRHTLRQKRSIPVIAFIHAKSRGHRGVKTRIFVRRNATSPHDQKRGLFCYVQQKIRGRKYYHRISTDKHFCALH
jgi:GxGYxY sequence motif in domain of unknown function N-terminal/GxGYxYP putative glycoside hydrolase C-terminal domain